MDFFSTFIYGLVQGIAEFLPISSSAHLALLPHILNIKDPGITFDLMMHLGTSFAILVYFYKSIFLTIKTLKADIVFLKNYLISLLSTFLILIFIYKFAENHGRNELLIAFNLMFFGVLMFVSDKKTSNHEKNFEKKLSIKDSIIIGIAQAFAVFPGVSRSGITVTASRFLSYNREQSFRFSFLLSLPIIYAGAFLKIIELSKNKFHNFDLISSCWGILFSFVFGILSIHFLMTVIQKKGLYVFTIYRVILGIILILYFYF